MRWLGTAPKDEVDLRWNAIRRAATARVDLEVRAWRERRLNEVLSELWVKFAAGINEGEVLELEPEYEQWIADALAFKKLSVGAAPTKTEQ